MTTLPTPGGSDGTYGTELNAFLEVSMDGTTGKILNEALQVASTAPVADAAIANKKYVDDIALMSPNPMTGDSDEAQGSVTFGNGTILKWGRTARTGNDTSTTFSSAFPNACFQVIACYGDSVARTDGPSAHTITTSGFVFTSSVTYTRNRWFAVGR